MTHSPKSECTNEIFNDRFGKAIPKIHLAHEAAVLQIHALVLSVYDRGVYQARLFRRAYFNGMASAQMQPLLQGRI